MTCSGVCLLLAMSPPFYGPVLTWDPDQFFGGRSVEKGDKKKADTCLIKMSDKVSYRLLTRLTIPRFQHQGAMPQSDRNAGRGVRTGGESAGGVP